MRSDEYAQICKDIARRAIAHALTMSANEDLVSEDVPCPRCARPQGERCVSTLSGHEAPEGFVHDQRAETATILQIEHWVDVFLDDDQLPEIDPESLLAISGNADAWRAHHGVTAAYYTPSPEVRAIAAFQADIWTEIGRMRTPIGRHAEDRIARGMLRRYRTARLATQLAHWHAMDHAEGNTERDRWLRVHAAIERMSKERR